MAPRRGLEPPTYRLTAECSTIELSRINKTGDDLLSHKASPAVSWALIGLTDVFGMGTGVALKDIDTRWLFTKEFIYSFKTAYEREVLVLKFSNQA